MLIVKSENKTTKLAEKEIILLLIAIVCLGAILRSINFWKNSLWLNELVTFWLISGESFASIIERCFEYSTNSPFYFFIVKISVMIFGKNEFSMRFPSIIFGITAIYIFYQLAYSLFKNKDIAIISALLFALNKDYIYYSQDARPYSLAILLTLISILSLIKYLEEGDKINWLVYVISSALIVYSQYISVIIFVFENIYFLIFQKGSKYDVRKRVKGWIFSQITIAILLLPILKHVLSIFYRREYLTYLGKPDMNLFVYYLGYNIIFYTLLLFLLIVVFWRLKLIIRFPQNITDYESITFLMFWYLVPCMIMFLLSYFTSLEVFTNRYLIVFSLPVTILIAYGISLLNERRLIIIFLLFYVSIYSIYHFYPNYSKYGILSYHTMADWRGAIQYVKNANEDRLLLLRSGMTEANLITQSQEDEEFVGYIQAPLSEFYSLPEFEIINLTHDIFEEYKNYYSQIVLPQIYNKKGFWLMMLGDQKFEADFDNWLQSILGRQIFNVMRINFRGVIVKKYEISKSKP